MTSSGDSGLVFSPQGSILIASALGIASGIRAMFLANDASLSRLQTSLPSHWSVSGVPTSAVRFPPLKFKFRSKVPVQLYAAVRQEILSCKVSLVLI